MEVPIAYNQIEDVYIVSRWDASQKFCIRIVIYDGSLLLQVCFMNEIIAKMFSTNFGLASK